MLHLSADVLRFLPSELLAADDIAIDTIEGDIYGTFNVTRRLSVHTRHGNIEAEVNVNGDGDGGDDHEPRVDARTEQGNVELTIASAPSVDIGITATTVVGDVSVIHNPAFLGHFKAVTVSGSIDILTDKDKELHFTNKHSGHVEGYVEEKHVDERYVSVSSSGRSQAPPRMNDAELLPAASSAMATAMSMNNLPSR